MMPLPKDELEAAALFAAMKRDAIRYCPEHEAWYVWDGKRWRRGHVVDAQGVVKDFLQAMAHAAADTHDMEKRAEDLQRARKWHTLQKVRAILELARGDMVLSLDQMDTDPYLFNIQNGTLSLRSGELQPHNPADGITKLANVTYDPAATAPRWRAQLEWNTCEHGELIAFKQRLMGYLLVGVTTEQIFVIAYGKGANGKSLEWGTVQRLFGDYAGSLMAETLMEGRHNKGAATPDIADLQGKRLALASESEDGAYLAAGLVKLMTGGDRLRARHLHANPVEFTATHTPVLFTNHLPSVKDTSAGMWRRMVVIPYDAQIADADMDRTLADTLFAEASGILNWLVEGCQHWQREELGTCPDVQDAKARYRADNDVIGHFIEECCDPDTKAKITAKALYHLYQGWCEETGTYALKRARFDKALVEKGFQTDIGHARTKSWVGLRKRADPATPGEGDPQHNGHAPTPPQVKVLHLLASPGEERHDV